MFCLKISKARFETKAWEDVGDDAAREKVAKFFAMQLPVRVSDRGHENEIRRAASDPLSADRQASIQSAFAHTPSIHRRRHSPSHPSQVVPGNATGILLNQSSILSRDYRPYSSHMDRIPAEI
jgi:hypothetical protein